MIHFKAFNSTQTRKASCRSIILVCLGLAFVLVLVIARRSEAQVLYGSIVGDVKDATQAAIPGATVTITHKETNQSRETVTNETGGYNFPTVPTGTYAVKVSMVGFKEFTKTDVPVTLNTVTRVDVALEVGQVAETVTVSAQATALQTDRAEVKSELPTKVLEDLPVPLGRNYQGLFRTLPGITPPANAHSVPSNPSRALIYNVNGATHGSNNTRIDGATSYNVWLPHITAYVPALESIEQVNVVTNSFDAEQGLAGGAAVSVQIKSGTNDLHGSAFEYHSDNKLKAKNFFIPPGERNPKLVYNQFGGTVGGPIIKDKLFYFGSYEGTYDRQFAFRFTTVPTMAMRAGDMSESSRIIYDPATGNLDGSGRLPFPGNRIPDDRISPIVRRILPLIPPPNQPGLANNYYAAAAYAFDRHTLDTKVNWNVSSKFTTFGRFSLLSYTMTDPEAFGALGGPEISSAGGNPGKGFGKTYSTTFAGTYIFSPQFIVDANVGWTRQDTNVEQSRLGEKLGLDFLGIPGTNGPRRFEGGWPRFSISNFTNLGINNDFMPYFRSDPQWQYTANANWTKGKHNLRFGTDFGFLSLNHTQPEFQGASHGASGGFSFSGGPTTIRGGDAPDRFNSFANFLLGLPTTVGRILQVPDVYTTRTSNYSFYIRDRWQVSRNLTLSYGTRWEYFPFPTRADRGMERYDFVNNKMLVCGIGVVPTHCGVKVSKRLFAPRFGLAYRVTEDFVIRAGYGITIDPYNLARNIRTNHPILLALTVSQPNFFQPAGRLQDGIPPIAAPDLGNGIIDVPGTVGVNSYANEFRRGYIQSWNLTLQKRLMWGFVGEAAYVATRQVRKLGFLDINAGRPGGGRASQPFNQRFGRTASTQVVGPVGNSQFDSLQVRLDRRFADGLAMGLAYTRSKSIGTVPSVNSDTGVPIPLFDFYHLNRSLSDIDLPHNLEITTISELPFGQGKRWANGGGLLSAVLGGWQLNGIFSAVSGTPFTVGASGVSLDAPGNSQRADQVKPVVQKLGGVGRGQPWFDPFAFAPVTEARFGTAGFNTMRGPRMVNLDLGLFRTFRVSERTRLEFRAEAFNFTNTPHFANPGANVSDLQLTPDGRIRPGIGYTEITSTRGTGREGIDERMFRFGLRLSF